MRVSCGTISSLVPWLWGMGNIGPFGFALMVPAFQGFFGVVSALSGYGNSDIA